MTRHDDKARAVTVATYPCRICTHFVVRHYTSAQGPDHDILGLNELCMRCYLDGKYEPGSLVEGRAPSPGPEGKTEP
ncbi:MAG: hypothetical protein FPO08_00570 [Geobacter sp.]|nr:MAG: hypothetical protein FPO08_00570 [Geobacter sp.]